MEASTTEIGSGWRSLFGTLKAVHFPCYGISAPYDTNAATSAVNASHWQAVLDVFEAFLATENPQVFANAALDYVTCLIHHVRGSEERQQLEELISIKEMDKFLVDNSTADLTCSALQYLLQCHNILRRMHRMSACPVFQGAHRIHLAPVPATVDSVVPDLDVKFFDATTETLPEFPYSYRPLQTFGVGDEPLTSDDYASLMAVNNNHRGLLRVWYLLLDGLTSAVINCPRSYQAQAVDTLFDIFNSLLPRDPGARGEADGENETDDEPLEVTDDGHDLVHFGLYATNHLLLPMLQSWLRRSQRTFQGWQSSGPNFKHCMGKTTELVMKWLALPRTEETEQKINLVFKQLLLILIECTVVPVESIARLGCSCFR